MKRLFVLSVCCVVLCAVLGCAPYPYVQDVPTSALGSQSSTGIIVYTFDETKDVHRFVDDEAGVVCWVICEYNTGASVSCLPIGETMLRKQ